MGCLDKISLVFKILNFQIFQFPNCRIDYEKWVVRLPDGSKKGPISLAEKKALLETLSASDRALVRVKLEHMDGY